jgi:hypothetical protein
MQKMKHMIIEFAYTAEGSERHGILSYTDGLLGPIAVIPDEESCCTYCGGYGPAGSSAVFLRQEIDSPVEFLVVERGEHPEGLLARFIAEWVPDRGDLREQLRALLGDYVGRS